MAKKKATKKDSQDLLKQSNKEKDAIFKELKEKEAECAKLQKECTKLQKENKELAERAASSASDPALEGTQAALALSCMAVIRNHLSGQPWKFPEFQHYAPEFVKQAYCLVDLIQEEEKRRAAEAAGITEEDSEDSDEAEASA